MVSAILQMAATSLVINAVAVTPQDWVKACKACGGWAYYDERCEVLSVAAERRVPLGLLYPKGVTDVSLVGKRVQNQHVSAVLKWPDIEMLNLVECPVIDDTVFPLLQASRLHGIHMHDVHVSAAGVSRLSGSKTIQRIDIATQGRKFADLKLTDMAQLRLFTLLDFNITSVELSNMPNLEAIFNSSNLYDSSRLRRVELSNLPLLEDLNFAHAPVDKLVVEKCKSLEEIRVKKAKLSDEDVATLTRSNPKLKILRK